MDGNTQPDVESTSATTSNIRQRSDRRTANRGCCFYLQDVTLRLINLALIAYSDAFVTTHPIPGYTLSLQVLTSIVAVLTLISLAFVSLYYTTLRVEGTSSLERPYVAFELVITIFISATVGVVTVADNSIGNTSHAEGSILGLMAAVLTLQLWLLLWASSILWVTPWPEDHSDTFEQPETVEIDDTPAEPSKAVNASASGANAGNAGASTTSLDAAVAAVQLPSDSVVELPIHEPPPAYSKKDPAHGARESSQK